MSIALLATIGGLTSVGLYLITARSLSRIILGFSLLGHASVLALLTAGGPAGQAPIAGTAAPEELSNPIPQALALTAIVISFGLTLFLLALAGRQQSLSGDDLVEDDLEDKRIGEENLPEWGAEPSTNGEDPTGADEAGAADTDTGPGTDTDTDTEGVTA